MNAGINNHAQPRVRLSHLRRLSECEQVAAVCYRMRNGDIEFLLVRTRGSKRWTFPKGSAEPGLTHAQAAALEAFEEAGVHGRIEEASFARYIRVRRSGVRSAGGEYSVSAHLCQVRRLSPAQESRRNRTWFAAEEARLRLREGRSSHDGAEFVRVVDKAVDRIQRLRVEIEFAAERPGRDSLETDGLQKVQFDFDEAYGREVSFAPQLRRQAVGIRRLAAVVDSHPREFPHAEVLQFSLPREKKPKTLGTGRKNG